MAVKTVEYRQNLPGAAIPNVTYQNTARGPSMSIWGDCPWIAMKEDLGIGMAWEDDFTMGGAVLNAGLTASASYQGSMGQWSVYADEDMGLAADPALEGGVISLNTAEDTGSITMAASATSYQMVVPTTLALGQKLWFECRVALASISSGRPGFFVGLVDRPLTELATSLPILSAGNTLSTVPNIFGFFFRATTNPSDVGVAFNVAGGTVQYPTNLQTLSTTVTGSALVAQSGQTGFVKLGFIFDPTFYILRRITSASSGQTAGNSAKPILRFFVNGQECTTFLDAADNLQVSTFPTGPMAPVISMSSVGGSVLANCLVDWIRVAQLASF